MIRLYGRCALSSCVRCSPLHLLRAASIPLRGLREMARQATLSFAGTVAKISYRRADDGRPVTDVKFAGLASRVAKGRETPSH